MKSCKLFIHIVFYCVLYPPELWLAGSDHVARVLPWDNVHVCVAVDRDISVCPRGAYHNDALYVLDTVRAFKPPAI